MCGDNQTAKHYAVASRIRNCVGFRVLEPLPTLKNVHVHLRDQNQEPSDLVSGSVRQAGREQLRHILSRCLLMLVNVCASGQTVEHREARGSLGF